MPNGISNHLQHHRRFAVRHRHRQRGPPSVGALARSEKVQGRVVWSLEDGFLIEFTRLLHTDFLEDSVTGD
jgi:hypothetical protein